MTPAQIMNRLACGIADQLDVTRILFVTIANPYQYENVTYLWLYLETSNSPLTTVRLEGKPDEIQGIIDAERALREANAYHPFEWTKAQILANDRQARCDGAGTEPGENSRLH
jgi:predicted N-formylglutamate amidohydrolase